MKKVLDPWSYCAILYLHKGIQPANEKEMKMTNFEKLVLEAHNKTGLTGQDLKKFVHLFLADVALSQEKSETAKKVLDLCQK